VVVVRAVTVIMGTVVGLTFMFGFGNVLNLALRLGVPIWVAPLVAPAVDLSILGLLLGTRHLALHGATAVEPRPARRLLIFASLVTLALNVADPIVAGEYGKAAFDAVGPLLLIGWAEVGPGFLRAINTQGGEAATSEDDHPASVGVTPMTGTGEAVPVAPPKRRPVAKGHGPTTARIPGDLVARARQEDAAHRTAHQRPISADTLRRRLGIGAARSRRLVALVRAEVHSQTAGGVDERDLASGDVAHAA
jgi:hypothetical protein